VKYERLFSPITMRGVTFPNRIQRTSMVSGLSTEDGWVTDELRKRYQREAKGGPDRWWWKQPSLFLEELLQSQDQR